MANLKDLIVNGVARVIGKVYAPEFVGKLTGNADTSTQVKTTTDTTNTNRYLTFVGNNNSSATAETFYTDGDLKYNPNTNTLTASTFSGSLSGNASSATTATTLANSRTIDGVSFNGSANITHYGSCSTAASTVAKVVDCTGFTLATGAKIVVKFTVTNTASNPTLNVNSTGAKAIYYRGSAISAGYLASGKIYEFVYNGTQYELIGDLDTNTWRPVVDNLNSTSTDSSLSAKQGKVLNEKITNFDYRGRANTWSAVNTFSSSSDVNSGSSTASGAIIASNGGIWAAGGIRGNKVYNAVWNDLADCIPVDDDCELTPGYCYCFNGEKYYKSSKYLDDGIIGIHSDTYGMHMGYKDNCKQMDVAVAGFVLAYVDKEYPVGTPLTCTENGYLTKIEKSDKMEYPEKIVATYWKNEPSEYWGGEKDKIKVNGRKWVKVK